jgi:hypothetical protein
MDSKTARIRALNDELRQNFAEGIAVMTPGIAALGAEAVARIVKTVAVFDDFCHANDPHEEHDFGAFDADGHRVFFKIDYLDKSLTYHSPDPAANLRRGYWRERGLSQGKCRWPISNPGAEDFCFCGNEPVKGLPYCLGHARIAYRSVGRQRSSAGGYVPPQPRAERRDATRCRMWPVISATAPGHESQFRSVVPVILASGIRCNACAGEGHVRPSSTHYPFDVENVREFVALV